VYFDPIVADYFVALIRSNNEWLEILSLADRAISGTPNNEYDEAGDYQCPMNCSAHFDLLSSSAA
jgi:hypothetical protein